MTLEEYIKQMDALKTSFGRINAESSSSSQPVNEIDCPHCKGKIILHFWQTKPTITQVDVFKSKEDERAYYALIPRI